MQVDKSMLWEMKVTSDWKILGQRRRMRLQLHEKIISGESESKKENERDSCSDDDRDCESTVSFQEAWKALGRRRQYRSPPQSASSTPQNCNTVDLVQEFRAVALGTLSGERETERHCRSENLPAGESSLPVERPHISTLYFLAEMERFQ
mmetsp:Transcript_58740/g.122732  ORF Transcript_58740/g.122732 Transcript_58740/m.122732 type:complete len:150 (-) Transcript_58740:24-473(-)